MSSERWKWRSSSALRAGPFSSPAPSSSSSLQNDASTRELPPPAAEAKKPRVLTKALRTMSSSSVDSMAASSSRKSNSLRRGQKTNSSSGSGSMLERLQRRVSKDSCAVSPTGEWPASPMDQLQPFTAMEIVRCGTLKTDGSLRKSRAEYLVLSDQCLAKFSSSDAARSAFPQLREADARVTGTASPAAANSRPNASDIRFEVPLRSIIAAFAEQTSTQRFGIEIWWSSQWPKLASCKSHLFFALSNERDDWLASIQRACKARLRKNPASSAVPDNLKTRINHIVRATEPAMEGSFQNLVFPVAKCCIGSPPKTTASDESQDQTDVSSYFLVIGPCMCYYVEVLKADHSTLPGDLRLKVMSFGTVTLTRFRASVASLEQRFIMSFRRPFGREARLDLASTYYRRVIEALTKVDRILKPMWPQHFQHAIFDVKGLPPPLQLTSGNDLGGLETSLQAYCVAFQVQVPDWAIEWNTPSQPTFRLLPPAGSVYSPLQLLAVFRALRYNSFFKSISFRDVNLTSLAGRSDYSQYGDSVVYTSLSGHTLSEEHYDLLLHASVLEQEMHALMFASESIRSIDATNVLGMQTGPSRNSLTQSEYSNVRKMSSEALRPILVLLKRQMCLCHSISLSKNLLATSDVDELANMLVLDHLYFKKLELAKCGLGDAGLSKLWVGLAGQADCLTWIDTSDNQGTVHFDIIRTTLSQLCGLTGLKIAGNTRIDLDMSLFDDDAIASWALEELDLSGILLNDATVDVLAYYLQLDQSYNLEVLTLNHCGLTARQVAKIFRGMGHGRRMTVRINGSRLDEGIEDLCETLAYGFGPWGLFMQMVEFNDEISYVKLLQALASNKTIECLSLAGSATPDEAGSDVCQAVSEFFSKNTAVRFLDISGFESKLDEGRLGREFSRSLSSIRTNTRIEHLRVRSQMLNFNVGDLAEAISANETLHTLDCEGNDFNLSNFRHLIKHLESNSAIRHFSAFSEQELARTISKAVEKAAPAPPVRRASVMTRLRQDKPRPATEKPLTYGLEEEWDAASATLQQILEKNRKAWLEKKLPKEDVASPTQSREPCAERIFSTAFGGLALKDYESRIAMETQSSSSPQEKPSTDGSSADFAGQAGRLMRPASSISSEVALSPTTDDASTRSGGAPTPPEVENVTDKGISLGNAHDDFTVYDDPVDGDDAHDANDMDGGLQMKRYRRFWSEQTTRIEEEASGSEADG